MGAGSSADVDTVVADVEAFHEILDAPDSGVEVASIDGAVARTVGRIPCAAVADPFDG